MAGWAVAILVEAFVAFLYTDVSNGPDGSLCTSTSRKGNRFSVTASIVKLIPGSVVLNS